MSMLLLTGVIHAQTAGSTITGTVFDSNDNSPLSMVNVVEIDETNRIVKHAVANINGEFSFILKDPKDRIKVTYVGYEDKIIPIRGTTYKIAMKSKTIFEDVVVVSQARTDGAGLSIPKREVSGVIQKIDASEFEGLGITSIDEALQGRVSGLDIVFNSGNLGSGTSMRLRGVASINGNSEPLVVVDGNILPSNQLQDFDFNNANDEKFAQLLNVNPEDIQSINILKDAASTAIWGSQGTNGVIEIKTKRGSRGRTRVGYSYRLSASYQPDGMKMLNGDQYTMLLKEEYFNPGLNDVASNIIELNYDPSFSEYEMFNNNTDWISAVKQIGTKHSHSVNLSGGGEKANFRISAGYDKEIGSIIEQNLDRFTTRVALDYFVSDRIKFVTNFDMSYTNNDQNYSGLLGMAYDKMPNLAIYEEDKYGRSTGKYYNTLSTMSSALSDQKTANPIALAYEAWRNTSSINITPVFELQYNLLGLNNKQTQLKYEGRIAFSIFNSYNTSFYPSSLQNVGWSSSNNNSFSNSSNKSQSINHRHQLTFNPKLENPDHVFSALVRAEFNTGNSSSQNNSAYGLPNIQSASIPSTIGGIGSGIGESRGMNFAFQAHYAYMRGKYSLDFTSRLDATTKLGPKQRWRNQPSFSGRWNISDEDFMKDIKWLTMLSIRPSLGINGVPPGSDYLFFSRYSAAESYNGYNSVAPNNIRLSSLKMEKLVRWNLGTDFAVLDDKFSGDINLYSSKKSDMLQGGKPIPTSTGYETLSYQNSGSLINKGWDFNINANRIIKKGKFSLDFNITFNNNSNTLLTLDPNILASYNKEFNRSNGSYLTRVQLHNSLGAIYGFKYNGVYQYSDYSKTEIATVSGPDAPVVRNAKGEVVLQSNGKPKPMYFCYGTNVAYEFRGGDAKYEDVNHDGNINELDIVYLGSSLPLVTGGFGFRLRYDRFSMNNQFNLRLKQKVVNAARMNAESMYTNKNQCLSVNWRWRVEGDVTRIPRALKGEGRNYLGSDRFVEDASFLRMNYTQFSYSFDPKILKTYGLSSLSVNLSMNNLFVLTKYSGNDPEVGAGSYSVATDGNTTPRAKSLTAGISANF